MTVASFPNPSNQFIADHRRDLHRGLVVTTHSVAELPILKEVTGALGSRCAGVFGGVVMHVPRKTTELPQKEIARLDIALTLGVGF